MTDDARDAVAPNFRDRARACRLILAVLSEDMDMVRHIIGEPQNTADVVHLIVTLADEAFPGGTQTPNRRRHADDGAVRSGFTHSCGCRTSWY